MQQSEPAESPEEDVRAIERRFAELLRRFWGPRDRTAQPAEKDPT